MPRLFGHGAPDHGRHRRHTPAHVPGHHCWGRTGDAVTPWEIRISPELQKLSADFNREMQDALPRINEVCRPACDSLVQGMRNLDAMLSNVKARP